MIETIITRTPCLAPRPMADELSPFWEDGALASKRADYSQAFTRPHQFKNIPSVSSTLKQVSFTKASQDPEGLVGDSMSISRLIITKMPGSKLGSGIISDQLIGETTMTSLPRGLIKSAKA